MAASLTIQYNVQIEFVGLTFRNVIGNDVGRYMKYSNDDREDIQRIYYSPGIDEIRSAVLHAYQKSFCGETGKIGPCIFT